VLGEKPVPPPPCTPQTSHRTRSPQCDSDD